MEDVCLVLSLLNQNYNQYVIKMYVTQLTDIKKPNLDNKWANILKQLHKWGVAGLLP
jgi:predicted YcjX-like family ATPase